MQPLLSLLVTLWDDSDYCGVISKLVQEGAQHTALWGAGAQHASGGEAAEKVLYPGTLKQMSVAVVMFQNEQRSVVGSEEYADLAGHPGFMIWEDPNVFVQSCFQCRT